MKIVVLSTNDNPDYLHYLPIVINAWNKLGWNVLTFYRGKSQPEVFKYIDTELNHIWRINEDSEYKDATIVQVVRLFASCLPLEDDDMLMTSDVDMLPCSNYWNPDINDITVYGHDLTGYTEYPICYIAMSVANWRKVMNLKMNEDIFTKLTEVLNSQDNAKSEDFYKWWGVDQQYITEQLKKYELVKVNRGNYLGYALGRVDRGDWENTLTNRTFIDSHLLRPAKDKTNIEKTKQLLIKLNLLPDWYDEYAK